MHPIRSPQKGITRSNRRNRLQQHTLMILRRVPRPHAAQLHFIPSFPVALYATMRMADTPCADARLSAPCKLPNGYRLG